MRSLLLLVLLLLAGPAAARPARAYVAASIADAVEAAALAFARTGAERPIVVRAGSPELARRIAAGAPAGVVIVADTRSIEDLARRRLLAAGRPVVIAENRLVLVVPVRERRAIDIAPGFDLGGLVGVRRWVTADPASVPLGRYAEASLRALGSWEDASVRLVRAADARAALAFVERGDVAMGIVYATDARASRRVAVAGEFPAASHPPIVYPLALTRGAPPEAAAFARFLRGPEAANILRARGFGSADPARDARTAARPERVAP